MNKIIFVIDLDCFYASCEIARNPELKNKPVAVGKLLNNRGIVTTASYEARGLGVKSAMPIYKAKLICKDLILVDPDHAYYEEMSERVFQIVMKYSKKIEMNSIDECFLDVTEVLKSSRKSAIPLAKKIQDEVMKETGLGISVGISSNKPLAKIACGVKKPLGIYSIFPEEIENKLHILPIDEISGVGHSSNKVFEEHGIKTIGDLANLTDNSETTIKLRKALGVRFVTINNVSKGIGTDNIITDEFVGVKSISHNETFEVDVVNYEEFIHKAFKLVKEAFGRMRYRGLCTKIVGIAFQGENSRSHYKSKRKTLPFHTDNLEVVWVNILSLIDKWWTGKPVRALGISLSNLSSDTILLTKQTTIDDFRDNPKIFNEELDPKGKVLSVINKINFNYGSDVVFTGHDMVSKKRYVEKRLTRRDGIKFKTWEGGYNKKND